MVKTCLAHLFTVLINVLVHALYAVLLAGIMVNICSATGLPFGWSMPPFWSVFGALMCLSACLVMARLAWKMPQHRLVRVYGEYEVHAIDPERRTKVPE